MAAQMAAAAGWWHLDCLLASVSAQAAAGARPELLPLIKVSGMDGRKARALYAHGITSPEALGRASEEALMKALTAAVSRRPRALTAANKREAAFKAGTTALIARSIAALRDAARLEVLRLAQEQLEDTADVVFQATQADAEEHSSLSGGSVIADRQTAMSASPEVSGPKLSGRLGRRDPAPPPAASTSGMASHGAPPTTGRAEESRNPVSSSVHVQLGEQLDPTQLRSLQESLREQASCSIQLLLGPPSTDQLALTHHNAPLGAALCWKPGHVLYIDLAPAEGQQRTQDPLQLLQQLLDCAFSCLRGFNLGPQLAALALMGVRVSAPVEDLQLAAALMWPQRHQTGMSIDDVHAELAPTRRIRVAPLPRPSATHACRTASLVHALTPAAHTLLSARRLSVVYRDLDARLLPILSLAPLRGPLLDVPLLAATQRDAAAALHTAQRQLADVGGRDLDPRCEASVNRCLRRLGAPSLGTEAVEGAAGLPLPERLRRALAVSHNGKWGPDAAHFLGLLLRRAELTSLGDSLSALRRWMAQPAPGTGPLRQQFPWTSHMRGTCLPSLQALDTSLDIPWCTGLLAPHDGFQAAGVRDLLQAAPPFTCLISIRLPTLPLSVLAHLTADPHLLQALDAPDPFASLAALFSQTSRHVGGRREAAEDLLMALVEGWQPWQLAQKLRIPREAAGGPPRLLPAGSSRPCVLCGRAMGLPAGAGAPLPPSRAAYALLTAPPAPTQRW
eukprot:jgi/Botrbrau1/1327/Bobra.0063s0041.1